MAYLSLQRLSYREDVNDKEGEEEPVAPKPRTRKRRRPATLIVDEDTQIARETYTGQLRDSSSLLRVVSFAQHLIIS